MSDMAGYVIEKIIEKAEKSTVDWHKGAAGNRSFPLKEYNDRDCKTVGRSEFAGEARALEQQGILTCRWYQRYSELTEIKYRLEDLPEFYRMAGRREKADRMELMIRYLQWQQFQIRKKWIREFLEESLNHLKEGKIPVELKAVDVLLWDREYPVENWPGEAEDSGKLELFSLLRGLDALTEPIYKRIFSSRQLKDRRMNGKVVKASKGFEAIYQGNIISLARHFHPDVDESMDDTQVLSQLYLEEYAQELKVKGCLKVELNRQIIDLSAFTYGAVLNSQTLKNGRPGCDQQIKKIITVENQANYEAMEYEQGTLIIFSHGYFTPKEREFLIQLRECLQDQAVEYYHTGDLDYGGICIFRYIRERIFPDVKPLYMDIQQYERYQHKAEPLDTTLIEKLCQLEEPLLQPLIQRMVTDGVGIEQENFIS